jgi:hypothetical protein
MSDTSINIADSARAGNGAATAIGTAARNAAPIPTIGYIALDRSPGEAARPLNAHSERNILDLIGVAIGPRYPIGSASRWHKQAAGIPEKRLAEALASLVFNAADDEPLARRVAIAGARAAACHAPGPLPELIAGGFAVAIDAIERETAEVDRRLAVIRVRRTRAALREIAAQRREMEAEACALDREAAKMRREVESDRRHFERIPDHPMLPALRQVWVAVLSLDVPKYERRAATIRAAMPSYRLTAGQRGRLTEFSDRLRRLRAARRALQRALCDLDRAKATPPPAKPTGEAVKRGR